jgi:dihydrodipicolinate synthase/N-acetylneuraminate lyase
MKAAMNLMTPINVGPPRPPLTPLDDQQIEQLKEDLTALQLLQIFIQFHFPQMEVLMN